MELTMEKLLGIVGRLYVTSNNLSEQLERVLQELDQIKQESAMKDRAISALRDEINSKAGNVGNTLAGNAPLKNDLELGEVNKWNIATEKT